MIFTRARVTRLWGVSQGSFWQSLKYEAWVFVISTESQHDALEANMIPLHFLFTLRGAFELYAGLLDQAKRLHTASENMNQIIRKYEKSSEQTNGAGDQESQHCSDPRKKTGKNTQEKNWVKLDTLLTPRSHTRPSHLSIRRDLRPTWKYSVLVMKLESMSSSLARNRDKPPCWPEFRWEWK